MKKITTSVCCVLGACFAGFAKAEEPTYLDTITINSPKRSQDLDSFPGTVLVADEEDLEQAGADTISDLDRIFPDLAIDSRSSRIYTNVTIRGQSSVDFYNPSVQVYIDGHPQDAGSLGQVLPFGIESVETLYGPQGTLYGRGAVGGVISIETVKPGDGPDAQVVVDYNSGGYHAAAIGQITSEDGFASDIAIGRYFEESSYTQLGTGIDIGETTHDTLRWRLRYAPETSPWDIMLSVAKDKIDSEEEQYVPATLREQRQVVAAPSAYEQETLNLGLVAHYETDGAKISSITSWQDRDLERVIFGNSTPETQATFSQELRIASQGDGPVNYVVGVSYNDVDFTRSIDAAGILAAQDIRSAAIFGELTWDINDIFSLTGGLRYDYEEADLAVSGPFNFSSNGDWGAVSYKVGLSAQLSDQVTLFGLHSTGFKAGGFTRSITSPAQSISYDPQYTRNYEAGIRFNSPDGMYRAELAGYFNTTEDYQMFVGTQPFQYLQNVGEVEAKGINASFTYTNEAFKLTTALGVNETTFSDYNDPTNPLLNFTGNRVPYAPKFTKRLTAQYDFEQENGAIVTPYVSVAFQDSVYFDAANSISEDSYILVDAGVNLKFNENLSVKIYGENLLDENYATYGFNAGPAGTLLQLGKGREIGIQVKSTF